MKILETQRLLIEEVTLHDASFFFNLMNSPNWLEHIGDRNINSLADAEKHIQDNILTSYVKNGFGFYKMSIKSNEEPIGAIGFFKREHLAFPDIGYAILPQYESKGYISEAAKAMMDYGKQKLELKTIFAFTTKKNLVSQKVLSKIGLHLTETKMEDGEEILYYST